MTSGYDLLAKYFGGPVRGPAQADVAKYILLNAKRTNLSPNATSPNEPSVMGRIFDILSRPNYAIANSVDALIKGQSVPEEFWKGLSGVDKTTFSDVLKAAGSTNDAGNAVLGFGLDVLTDPLTYVGGAGLSKLGKLGKATEAAKPEENLAQKLLSRGEPVHPESFGLEKQAATDLPPAFKPAESVSPMDMPQAINVKLPSRQLELPLDLTKAEIPNEERLIKQAEKPAPVEKTAGGASGKQLKLKLEVPPVSKTIESVATDSATVKNILDKISLSKIETEGSNLLSDTQLFDFDKFLKKFGTASAKAAGVSPAAEKSTEELVKLAVQSGKTPAQVAVEQNSRMLDNIIATGKQTPEAAGVVTRGLEKDLGTLPKYAQSNNKAVEYLMGRVATWWGQRDLRPFSLNAIGSSAATAAARGKALHELMAPFDAAQRHEALRLAQGFGTASSPDVEQLATQIKRMMDNLTGRVSVIGRSAVDKDMLNKWMGRYGVKFKFTNGKTQDITGNIVDYSKGADWTQSWKTHVVDEDPEAYLFKFQSAVEQATREKALYDEIGQRFGRTVPGGGYKTKIEGHPYLQGYYFPEEIAKQIPRVVKDWSIEGWKPGSPLLKLYDRVLSMWKSGVTIYRPAHHIRNYVGDIYLGWLDGVNSARPYMLATRVQRTMKDAYTDLQDVDKLVEVGLMSRNYATPKPGEVLFRNRSGVPFTAEQIGAVAHQKGLLQQSKTIEDIIDLGDEGRKSILNAKPFGGKVQKFARSASELIDHNARLAHFIDKVAKSKGNNLADIFEQAARRARKWHPSGLDMTEFEKKYLRRIIPFYTWMRKSTPLLMEGLAMNPGKIVGISKAYDAMQTAAGIDTPGRDNPFPVDKMFPQWMRAQGLGPIGLPDGILGTFSNQSPPGYVMMGVGLNPLSDLMSQIEQPQRTVLSSLTPAAQIPLELLQGQKTFTGEPIYGSEARPGAFGQYVGENIPIVSALQGITGITPFGGETRRSEKSGGDASVEALVNFLTAAGIKGTGPYTKQAYYEKYQPKKDERAAQKYEFLKELKG